MGVESLYDDYGDRGNVERKSIERTHYALVLKMKRLLQHHTTVLKQIIH